MDSLCGSQATAQALAQALGREPCEEDERFAFHSDPSVAPRAGDVVRALDSSREDDDREGRRRGGGDHRDRDEEERDGDEEDALRRRRTPRVGLVLRVGERCERDASDVAAGAGSALRVAWLLEDDSAKSSSKGKQALSLRPTNGRAQLQRYAAPGAGPGDDQVYDVAVARRVRRSSTTPRARASVVSFFFLSSRQLVLFLNWMVQMKKERRARTPLVVRVSREEKERRGKKKLLL